MSSTKNAPSATAKSAMGSQRIFEKVMLEIRQGIQNGELKIGDRLPRERELADHFQVSRNTIREALRSLENSGLLKLRRGPGGGAFVSSGDSAVVQTGMSDLISLGLMKPEHLREARMIIGVAAARLAAERRTPDDLETLRVCIADFERAVNEGNDAERVSVSFQFHRLLAAATKNPALVMLTDAVIELNESLVRATGLRDPKIGLAFRRKMLRYIEDRDAEGASTEMANYLDKLRRYYESRLNAAKSNS